MLRSVPYGSYSGEVLLALTRGALSRQPTRSSIRRASGLIQSLPRSFTREASQQWIFREQAGEHPHDSAWRTTANGGGHTDGVTSVNYSEVPPHVVT